MDKEELSKKYPKEEDKLIISKIWDKIEMCKTKNKITHTDFLDLYQRSIAEKLVNHIKSIFYGGYDGAERTILILYPDKLEQNIIENTYTDIFKIIRIKLPNNLKGKYQHKNYLGAVMKLGDFGAMEVEELTRFSKSEIEILELEDLKESENKKEDFTIMVPSLRLDCIVSELMRSSRTKANEAILSRTCFY